MHESCASGLARCLSPLRRLSPQDPFRVRRASGHDDHMSAATAGRWCGASACDPAEDYITLLPSLAQQAILSHLDTAQDVCRAAQVCKLWSSLAKTCDTWRRWHCRRWGVAVPPPRALDPQLGVDVSWWSACRRLHDVVSNPGASELEFAWSGWCEDGSTTAGGSPYHMEVAQEPGTHAIIAADVMPGMTISTRQCVSTWRYIQPLPKTRMSVVSFARPQSPMSAAGAAGQLPLCTSTGRPLLDRFVRLDEWQRIPGSGPVDVPVDYTGVAVGPVLLGTFLPLPPGPGETLDLGMASDDQAWGCFYLAHASLLAAAAGRRQEAFATTQAFRGTVLTNFWTAPLPAEATPSGAAVRLGKPQLGEIRVEVVSVTPPPRDGSSRGSAVLYVRLRRRLHHLQRNLSRVPCLGLVDPETDAAIDGPITCSLTVTLGLDGRIEDGADSPHPRAPLVRRLDSGSGAARDAARWSLAQENFRAETAASAAAAASQGGDSGSSVHAPLPPLVLGADGVLTVMGGGASMVGLLSGGVLCGMLTLKPVGRCVFCAVDEILEQHC